MTELQLELAAGEQMVEAVEVLDGVELVGEGDSDAGVVIGASLGRQRLTQRNLFGEAERIAARAASAGTRRQYAAIYRAFAYWLRGQLGRPPVVGDLDADVIAAYGRHLASIGGRGGRPAAPATARVCIHGARARAPARLQGCDR